MMMERALVRNRELPQTLVVLGLAVMLFLVCCYLVNWLPMGDWVLAYRPACLRLLAGKSPYAVTPGELGFFNPVWALFPLLPIAMLPLALGKATLAFCYVVTFGYVAYKLGAEPIGVGCFLLSFPVICGLGYGQIGWMVALGFVLPPQWGLLLVMAKPQSGIGIALFWLWKAWRSGGFKKLASVSLPTAVGVGLSAAMFLADPVLGKLVSGSNVSPWPYLIPVGIALIGTAIFRRDSMFAIPAAQCLSPYVQEHSLACVLLATVKSTKLIAILSLASWGLIFLGN